MLLCPRWRRRAGRRRPGPDRSWRRRASPAAGAGSRGRRGRPALAPAPGYEEVRRAVAASRASPLGSPRSCRRILPGWKPRPASAVGARSAAADAPLLVMVQTRKRPHPEAAGRAAAAEEENIMTRLFAIFAILLITVAAISLQQAIPDPAREAALGAGSSPGMEAPGGRVTRVAYYYV